MKYSIRYRKKLLVLVILLAGCATQRPVQPTAPYKGVMPTYDHEVSYRNGFNRASITNTQADQRARAWFTSVSRIVRFEQQKPIRRKTDLVYLGQLQAYPLPNSGTFPPVRFWMTVYNQADSTRVWLTNFEVVTKRGWEPLEKQSFDYLDSQSVALRLTDLDGMATVLLEEFREYLTRP